MINPAIQEVIDLLLSLGLPPLPVARAQSADKYPLSFKNKEGIWEPSLDKEGKKKPRFTGKNPSYIDAKGNPKLVKHQNYQDKLPTSDEINIWFPYLHVGIGTLGSVEIIWIDIDKKQFESEEECTNRFNALLEKYPQLKGSWIEQTHSGGYRIAVKVKQQPGFTNFSLDGIGGKHHGEALGYGRFTVLAPTIGVSGKPYVCINRAIPVEVESLESIGIYPVRKEADKKQSREGNQNHSDFAFEFEQVSHPDKIAILPLISKKADYILNGESSGDRSKDLVYFAREVLGWGNWLNEIKIAVEENQNELINKAAAILGVLHRTDKILSDINHADCLPGIHYHQSSIGCWDKMKKANLEAFEKFAPDKVKEILEKPLIYSQEMPSGIPFESSRYFNPQQLKKWDSKKEYKGAELQDTPYLDLSKIPKYNAIIPIKASMGLGKTDAGLNCTKEAEKDSICSFWIAPRTKLNKQTVARAWEKGIKMFLVNEDDNLSLVLDGDSHLALCGESLHKLDGYFKGKDIYLDETTSQFKQLLSGGTVKGGRQGLILKVLVKMFAESNRVFLMDANLTDLEVKLVADFAPEKQIFKIENTFKRGSADIKILQGVEEQKNGTFELKAKDKSALIQRLANPNEVVAIPCDSKNFCKDIEKLLFDNNKWGFTLHQETSEETWQELFRRMPQVGKEIAHLVVDPSKKWSNEFLEDPNAAIQKYNPKFFCFSPTAESGVSITCKYFTLICAFFVGTISTDSQTQMLFRVRDLEIPRFIYCPEVGIKAKTCLTQELIETEMEIQRELNSNLLIHEIHEKALNRVDKKLLQYNYEIEENNAFEKDNLRSCLLYKLRLMGHNASVQQAFINSSVNVQMKINRDENNQQEAKEIFEAEAFENLEIAKEENKKNFNLKTKRRYEKTKILTALPEIKNSDIWCEDFILKCFVKDKHCLSQYQRYWLLSNPEIEAKSNDYWNFLKLSIENSTVHTIRNEQEVMLICLRELGIDRLIEGLKEGYTFNKNSEDINAILTKARKHKHLKKLKKYCPGKPTSSKQEVVPFIKSLLALVGIKLKMEEQARNEQGIQERWYSLDRKAYHDIYRKEMLIAIEKQYHTWIEKEYIKPNWEYLKTEGTLPDEFKKVVKEQDIEIGEQKVSFEESIGESGIGFTDSEEGYINYTFPDKHILKIVRKYAKYLKGELNLEDISYSKEALDKAVQVIADIERYPTIKEELAPLFV